MFKINQENFIVVIVVILVVIKLFDFYISENFESNYYPCDKNPFNSNCSCPSNAPQKVVLGQFPINYGEKAPFVYTCVPVNAPEPPTNNFVVPN